MPVVFCFSLTAFSVNPKHFFRALPALSFLAVGLLSTGCVSTSTPSNHTPSSVYQPAAIELNAPLSDLLRAEAESWAGTPHEFGGTSRSGIDCSALVQTFYRDLLSVDIPRTTEQQVKVGKYVKVDDVQVGDLIFYRIDRNTRHVGIYAGDNEFIHASKSEGVTISPLDDDYWQKRFWTIRRILEDEPLQADETESVPAKRARNGW